MNFLISGMSRFGDVVLELRKQLSQRFLCDGCFFF
jgi:hypothetical protein